MLFHTPVTRTGMSPATASEAQRFRLDYPRIFLCLAIIFAMALGAFLAHRAGWSEGSFTLSHFATAAFGAMMAQISGEHSGLASAVK